MRGCPSGEQALTKLRAAFANSIVIVIISHLEVRHLAAHSVGADAFISRADTADRVALHLRLAAAKVHPI